MTALVVLSVLLISAFFALLTVADLLPSTVGPRRR
jgi:hypothetical protein